MILLCAAALCDLTLFAQSVKRPHIVHTTEKSAIHMAPQEAPESLTKIYGNLGTKTDLYNDRAGWGVSGPASRVNNSEFIALPFTPKANAHVSQARVAIQYGGFGANQINLSLYGDANGSPGTLLAGPVTVTNLPVSGTCCTLAIANFSPVSVTAGTQYWIVADTPLSGAGSDFLGYWKVVAKPIFDVAFNPGDTGWFTNDANLLPAGEVLGSIP
jgi:hypothetical protein